MASLYLAFTNEAANVAADGTTFFGDWTILDFTYMHVHLGFTASKQRDTPMGQIMTEFDTYLQTHPGNLSFGEMADALGAQGPKRVQDMFWNGFGPLEFMRAAVGNATISLPSLPRASGDGGMPAVFWIMTLFATFSIVLRIWSRRLVVMRVLTHDWLMVIGFVLTLVYNIIALLHAQLLAPNMAVWDMSWNTYSRSQAYQTVLSLGYALPLFFIKTSLLLFYLPLCPSYRSEIRSVMRTCIFVTFFFVVAASLTNVLVIMFQCQRFDYWNEEVTTWCRFDARMAQVIIGAFGVVTDIVIWLMPLPLVWKLDLGRKEKWLAVLTFGLAAVACIVSGFRLRAMMLFQYVVDGKFESVHVNVLTVVELNIAIICSSAPAIRALILHYYPHFSLSGKEHEKLDDETTLTNPEVQMKPGEFVQVELEAAYRQDRAEKV